VNKKKLLLYISDGYRFFFLKTVKLI